MKDLRNCHREPVFIYLRLILFSNFSVKYSGRIGLEWIDFWKSIKWAIDCFVFGRNWMENEWDGCVLLDQPFHRILWLAPDLSSSFVIFGQSAIASLKSVKLDMCVNWGLRVPPGALLFVICNSRHPSGSPEPAALLKVRNARNRTASSDSKCLMVPRLLNWQQYCLRKLTAEWNWMLLDNPAN